MHPVDALRRLGGTGTRAQLVAMGGREELSRALGTGLVVRDSRGHYALPTAPVARRAAAAECGVVSHLSAAVALGWEVKDQPALPHLTVPRNRNVTRAARLRFVPHWAALSPWEVEDGVTGAERTLLDCLTTLPPDEGLCVADSALRHRAVEQEQLQLLTGACRGNGSARARLVASLADGRAANPFESTLRWIASTVPGLEVEPQVVVEEDGTRFRPDLVDVRRRVVLEADSATWHTSRQALRRDCRRYNRLTLAGWLVLRFAWEDVMRDPDRVRRDLVRAAERARRPPRRRTAA